MWKILAAVLALFAMICACGGAGAGIYWWTGRQGVTVAAEGTDAPADASVGEVSAADVKVDDDKAAKISVSEGRAAYQQDRFEDALADFDNALALDPKDPVAMSWRGRTYAKLERFDRAEADLRDASARLPDDLETWRSLGWVRDRKEDDLGAIAAWDHAVGLAPDDAKLRLSRANTLFKLGRRLPAVDDATAACSLGLPEGCTLRDRLHGLR